MLHQIKPIAIKNATDDPIISDPNRAGNWVDQGDGTSLREPLNDLDALDLMRVPLFRR
jgi:hypothetical protein